MSLILGLVSALAPLLMKFALGWLQQQGAAQATETVTQAVINAPRSGGEVQARLKAGTF